MVDFSCALISCSYPQIVATVSSLTGAIKYHHPWKKEVLNDLQWTFKGGRLSLPEAQYLRKLKLMLLFKSRDFTSMNTSSQYNLNIGIYGYVLDRRNQRLEFWRKGVKRHIRREKGQDLKMLLGWQQAPLARENVGGEQSSRAGCTQICGEMGFLS